MGQAELQPRRYKVAEYLAAEVWSEVRHDFVDGQLVAHLYDTATHNELVLNCLVATARACAAAATRCTRWASCWCYAKASTTPTLTY